MTITNNQFYTKVDHEKSSISEVYVITHFNGSIDDIIAFDNNIQLDNTFKYIKRVYIKNPKRTKGIFLDDVDYLSNTPDNIGSDDVVIVCRWERTESGRYVVSHQILID